MRATGFVLSCISALSALCAAQSNLTSPEISKQILPSTFKPPQVFRNNNLVRTVNLEKEFPRETINVVVENVDNAPQQDYYLPFEQGLIARVGGLEVRDKTNPDSPFATAEIVGFDTYSPTEFYKLHFNAPLAPSEKVTLSITFHTLAALEPLPASISQAEKQYVQYTFSAYAPSAYMTLKQKTKLKLPTTDVPDYTIVGTNADGNEDPQKQGVSYNYGPYAEVPAGTEQIVSVRYDFTKPLLHATLLERDIEVSHWGGNLAVEERYWLGNRGATLKNHFSRVQWQQMQYYNPPTSALRELRFPLAIGSVNPYFTDDIGNVSTSRFRSNAREANLELKPRYPVFGGWKYSFRVGWDGNLKNFLRKLKRGDGYVLKVPFLEGPKMVEGVEYEKVVLRVVLPEGAANVKYETTVPVMSAETELHRTFMDTLGRTTLKLTALNVVDDIRERELVITYDYSWTAGFRKPMTLFASLLAVFGAAFLLSRLDVSIGRKA
ncbi:dolichyl-diphosphooligosaccharide--protein glycosyltransferase subunit 1 [Zalaria obscura]|uniref:Dolichyl-diphosphooligosaccharide--protein glycosyltransferase subunit 1 n=1 Tax=Zalaria obscura TaxID=2024903 RepID=A0ACC3SG97_9PEZI